MMFQNILSPCFDVTRHGCVSGPFVMNTQEEIMQAMSDYHRGKNGFEKAPGWESVDVKNERKLF